MSIGEDRVRTKFNPSADTVVDRIKQKSAELIDLCDGLKAKDPRLASLAQTAYEEAAMWAVKAATQKTEPPDSGAHSAGITILAALPSWRRTGWGRLARGLVAYRHQVLLRLA